MNTTVDFEATMENERVGIKCARELKKAGFDWAAWMQTPTALEIVEEIPGATIGKLSTGEWACCFTLANNYTDCRQDKCPHKAAAKAYIAWKNGMAI